MKLYNGEYEEKLQRAGITVPHIPLRIEFCGDEQVSAKSEEALEIDYYLDGENGKETEVYKDG